MYFLVLFIPMVGFFSSDVKYKSHSIYLLSKVLNFGEPVYAVLLCG